MFWPFKKKDDDSTEALTEVLKDVLASNVSIKSRLKAYERDRIALADEISVVRTRVVKSDASNDEEFGRINARLKDIEEQVSQWSLFQVEMRTALGVLRSAHQDLKTELVEFKVLVLKDIIKLKEQLAALNELEGQVAVIKQVTIGDLIDGGKVGEHPDLEEYFDSELEFLTDLQQAYKKYPRLNVIVGHWDGHVPSQNTEIEFQDDGEHIEDLEYKYCIREDGRIAYYNDTETTND